VEVPCERLCEAVVKALDAERAMPPATKLACDVDEDGVEHCADMTKEDMFEFEDGDHQSGVWHNFTVEDGEHRILQEAAPEGPEAMEVEYDTASLLRHLAHFYEIYPALSHVTIKNTEDGPSAMSLSNAKSANQAGIKMATRAISAVRSGNSDVKKFFGSDSSTAQSKARSVLNSAVKVMSNVMLVYPSNCDSSVNAYVYPRGKTCSSPSFSNTNCTYNSEGQFVFYICERLFLRETASHAAIVMAHEGTHMTSGWTSDHVYGFPKSVDLATSSPSMAQSNADNYMFFIRSTSR
jgi:hypothetical protein